MGVNFMAKVRCAKCGEIFGLQQGDIQLCPVCGCRMKVNRKPQVDIRPAPTPEPAPVVPAAAAEPTKNADEYDALRREYMDMMRDKLEKNKKGEDGVYLSREEYDALVKKASAPEAPASEAYQTQPSAAPAYARPVAPAPDDYANYDSPAADDAVAPAKSGKARTVVNWVSFLFALLAGAMGVLLLFLEVLKGTKITGLDLFLPGDAFVWPDTIVYGLIMFVPALCAIYALVSSAIKGKAGKFILFFLFLLCAVAALALPFVNLLMEGSEFSFDLISKSFESLSIFDILAVALNGLAAVVMLVAGIVVPSKKRRLSESDPDGLL